MGPRRALTVDRAGADDLLQLAVDRGGRVPMVIGALLVLDPSSRVVADELRAALLARSASVPRLRQRLCPTPPFGGRAVWLDAGSAAVSRCVDVAVVPALGQASREATVPSTGPALAPAPAGERCGDPGSERALLDATTDLVLTRLPGGMPLWRARVLSTSDGVAAAIALVAHHVVADGMGGLAVLGALADPPSGDRAGGTASRPITERAPEPLPPWAGLAHDAWARRVSGVRRAGAGAGHLAAGLDELGMRRPRLAERCSLLGATGDRRRLELATADLGSVRDRAHAHGASVNDVVVTAVTGALVELLAQRGERVSELVVSVPVSRRRQGEAGTLGNDTGVVPIRVPAVPDAAVRLAALVDQRARVGSPGRGRSGAVLTPAFRALAAVGAFQPFVDHQRLVHTFVTNVRGPAQPLQVAGAEVTAVVPVAVNPGNVAVSFDVLSYSGTLAVTLVCDPALVPESAWLAERVTAGLTSSG